MVAYALPSTTDQTPILDGRRIGLLLKPRAVNSRNPIGGPGSRVHLRIAGNREEPTRHLTTFRCVLRADVIFTKAGVQRVMDVVSAVPGTVEGLHALALNAEQGSAHDQAQAADKLARAVGYDDYAALWRDIGPKDPPFVVRTLLGWGAVS